MRHLIYNKETQRHEYVYRPDNWKPEDEVKETWLSIRVKEIQQEVVFNLNPKAEGLDEMIEEGDILTFDIVPLEEKQDEDTNNTVEVADEDSDLE